jgi:putative peptidoglycan lipid II flippase
MSPAPSADEASHSAHDAAGRTRLLRAALSLSVVTLLSRLLGLVREQVRAHYLGTSLSSDAFGIAFQIPNLLRRLVAEGAMTAGFIPVLSEIRAREGDSVAFAFTRRFFNLSLLGLLLLSTLGVLGAGLIVALFSFMGGRPVAAESIELTTSLTRWMFPYIALVSWAAVAQGLLNTFKIFWVSAFTAVLLNAAVIVVAIGFARHSAEPSYAFAAGVLLGGFLQFAFQVPYAWRLGFRWAPDFQVDANVRRALALLLPTVFGAGVYQLNVTVSQSIAWGLGNGAVSSLQYSARLLELTLGVFAVTLSTIALPTLSADAATGARDRVVATVLYSVRLCCIVCLPMTAALMLLRNETASLLFERGAYDARSTLTTGYAIGFHVLGLTHIAIGRVLVPVFYAYKDTRTPVVIGFVSMGTNVALCYGLAPWLAHGGIALASTISAVVQTFLLALLLRRHLGALGDELTARSVLLSCVATAVTSAAIVGLQEHFDTDQLHGTAQLALPYAVIVVAAVAVFAGVCLATRHPDLAELVDVLRRKVRGR